MRSSAGSAAIPKAFASRYWVEPIARPFARLMSPLARLLDFLSARHNVLFLVSAGNVTAPLDISDFATWGDFENAAPADREHAVLAALNAAKHERTLLSPAESLNALTVGAHHHDNVARRVLAPTALDPFDDPSQVATLCAHRDQFVERIREARAHWIYNLGSSGRVGATAVLDALESTRNGHPRP